MQNRATQAFADDRRSVRGDGSRPDLADVAVGVHSTDRPYSWVEAQTSSQCPSMTFRARPLPVSLDCHSVFDRRDGQSDPTSVGIQCRGRCDFGDEPCNEELLSVLNALCETDSASERVMSACEALRLR